ncbi:MAG TPA: acetylglutamate kinase [Verrucomicrobiae bacterium]|nr:acetylglutamate kinase [Verrucomicrobiae bacterium]
MLAVGTVVVKYGGNAMGEADGPEPLLEEIGALCRAGSRVVLVHGGGPEIDRALAERSIATRRVDGLRVTDAATLEVTEAVLCATLNKRLVRACLALGIPAVGVSGQDGAMLVARPCANGAELGYVGEIETADTLLLRTLLGAGYLPVVAPLAIAAGAAHAYNVNADLSAAALAAALRADAFVAVTNVARVYRDLGDPTSGIDRLSVAEAVEFAAGDACRSSMKPKLLAAASAVAGGAKAAYICSAAAGAIGAALAGAATMVAA